MTQKFYDWLSNSLISDTVSKILFGGLAGITLFNLYLAAWNGQRGMVYLSMLSAVTAGTSISSLVLTVNRRKSMKKSMELDMKIVDRMGKMAKLFNDIGDDIKEKTILYNGNNIDQVTEFLGDKCTIDKNLDDDLIISKLPEKVRIGDLIGKLNGNEGQVHFEIIVEPE